MNEQLKKIYFDQFGHTTNPIDFRIEGFVLGIRNHIYLGMVEDAKLHANKGNYLEAGIILKQAEFIKDFYFGD